MARDPSICSASWQAKRAQGRVTVDIWQRKVVAMRKSWLCPSLLHPGLSGHPSSPTSPAQFTGLSLTRWTITERPNLQKQSQIWRLERDLQALSHFMELEAEGQRKRVSGHGHTARVVCPEQSECFLSSGLRPIFPESP